MHRLSARPLIVITLTALAVGCGGSDNNNNSGDNDNIQAPAATQAEAAEAFPLFAQAIQVAFVAGQSHQTAAATGFAFAVPDTSCGPGGTYAIDGIGALADGGNPSAGGTYQFNTTFDQCATQTYAIDGAESETASISQTTVTGTTTTDEIIVATSDHLGFGILSNLQLLDSFGCGATDLHLHVQVTQNAGQAATQVVTGTGTWCGFTWDNSFVGDYQFVPQAN